MSDEPYVTKTGKVLSDEEIDALSAEAEGGYDVSGLTVGDVRARLGRVTEEIDGLLAVPGMYRWDVAQKFRVTRGQLGLQAESALYVHGVRREMTAGPFRYVYTVGAPTAVTAQAMAQARLFDLLRRYGVEVFVFDVRVVCLGVPQ